MRTQSYETSDIAFASYLFCSGAQLLKIDHQNPHRRVFVFSSPAPELFADWQQGKATVNALAFYNAYQTLKSKVFRGEQC